MPGPAPDAAAASVPTVHAQGGGGSGGGGSGKKGKKGKGKKRAGKGKGKEGAKGGKKSAKGKKGKGAGGCGDPVCPITGTVFLDVYDFGSPGPLELCWERHYSSRESNRSGDLGFGWSHPFGWMVEVRRRSATVYDETGAAQEFEAPPRSGEPVTNGFNWGLRRNASGLVLNLPDGRRLTFGPDAGGGRHFLVAVGDPNGNQIQIGRGPDGRLTHMIDSAGRPYKVATDRAGRVTGVSVAVEPTQQQFVEVARYSYDEAGDLVRAVDAEGHSAEYVYDRHLLIEHVAPIGLSVFYRYDGVTHEAYCIETWGEYRGRADPALEHPLPARGPDRDTRKVKGVLYVRFTHLKDQHYTEVENGLGGVSRYFGDDAGRIVKHIDAAGGVREYVYDDDHGGLIMQSSPDESVQRVLYDEDGAAAGFYDPSGKGAVIFDTEDGFEVTFNEHDESIVKRRFDRRGNLVFVQHPDGTIEEYQYDERGLMTSMIDRQGVRTEFDHDEQGNATNAYIGGERGEVSEYDYLGRRTAHVDQSNRRTEWRYDNNSEIVWKRHADGSEMHVTRDAMGKPTRIDEAGHVTRYEYGGMGWVTREIDPGGEVTVFKYDVEGNLTYVENARGQVFRQVFDQASRAVGCTTFEGDVMTAGYDTSSRRVWMQSANGRQLTTWDVRRRITAIEYPDGQVLSVEHALAGPTKIDNGSVVVEREYDQAGQIVRDKQGAHETRIAWVGGAVAAVVTDVGPPIEMRRGVTGELERIAAGRFAIALNQPSEGDRLTFFGDDLVLRQHFGPTSRLVRQSLTRFDPSVPIDQLGAAGDGNVLLWSTYEYDQAQALRRERRSDGTTIEYETDTRNQIVGRRVYDGGGRLLEEERVAYDRAGSPVVPGARYDSVRRPVELAGETFEYDAVGQLVRRVTDAGEWTYQWNASGDLVRVVAPHHVVEMDYDGVGRRLKKRVLRQGEVVRSTSYVWASDVVLREVDELQTTTRTYLRKDARWEPFGHVDSSAAGDAACLYILDPIGGVEAAVDAKGRVVWQSNRTIWGHARPTVAAVDVSARFPGQFYDGDVELVYNHRRWYDPRLGMYTSTDPLLLDGTFNPRDYVTNPLLFIDPDGLMGVKGKPTPTTRPGPTGDGHPRRPGMPGSVADMDKNYMAKPGHWATNGDGTTPGFAVATGRSAITDTNFSAEQKRVVNAAGDKFGCHSCGRKRHEIPGFTDCWRKDHQPPKDQVKAARRAGKSGEVRLYPHCPQCSNHQGTLVKAEKKAAKKGGKAADHRIDRAGKVMASSAASTARNAP